MRFSIALAATLLITSVQAQSPAGFEVVSIKPNRTGAPGSETETTPGRVNVINATPLSLLLRAFGVSNFQIIGAPDWAATERYDVVATVPGGRVLNDQERRPFFEKMLAERWQLRYHRDTRNLRVHSLVNDSSKLVQHTGPGDYGMKVERAGPRVILRSTRGNMGRMVEILGGLPAAWSATIRASAASMTSRSSGSRMRPPTTPGRRCSPPCANSLDFASCPPKSWRQ
jgi:uncharacterized protein (TIGR03435 family)